jgi:rhomboid protease GluP
MGFELILILSSVSTLLILIQQQLRGWRAVSGSLLSLFAIGWFVPDCEPLLPIGAWLWGLFIVLPLLGLARVDRLAQREQFPAAARWMQLTRWFHPLDGWWRYPEMLRALSLAQSGQVAAAKQIVQQYQSGRNAIERLATIMLYRMEGQWQGLIDWVQSRPADSAVRRDPNVQIIYLRALGETGQPEALIQQFQLIEVTLRQGGHPGFLQTARIYALAFAGQPDTVSWLLNQNLPVMTADVKQYWLGTAHWMAGSTDQAKQIFDQMRGNASPGMQAAIADRIARPAPDLRRELSAESRRWIGRLQSWVIQESQYSMTPRPSWAKTPVTYSLILINVLIGVFFFVAFGLAKVLMIYWVHLDTTIADTIGQFGIQVFRAYEMGVLEPLKVIEGEWWRLLTAAFLHAGWFHLLANMFGLYVLGGVVEPILGWARFAIGYLITGVGSMAIVTVLSLLQLIREQSVVGASGAIMGILGLMGAIYFERWRDRREALAAQRLKSVMMIVLFQTLFDAITPQVSMAGHLSGVILGFLVGTGLVNTVTAKRDS